MERQDAKVLEVEFKKIHTILDENKKAITAIALRVDEIAGALAAATSYVIANPETSKADAELIHKLSRDLAGFQVILGSQHQIPSHSPAEVASKEVDRILRQAQFLESGK